jgi:ribosomal protein S18 acetylase RimI-like enzyme
MELRFLAPAADLEAYLRLELLASAPYVRFVYTEPETATVLHRRLIEGECGEFAAPFGVLAVTSDGRPAGMFAGPLDAKQLGAARLKAANAMIKDPAFAGDAAQRQRATAARAALLGLTAGDAYLSRVAVAPELRGKGVGRAILRRFLDLAVERGAQRAVLEVAPEHARARELYVHEGFSSLGARTAVAAGRELVYEHMALHLASPQAKGF